ncbi:hypothetical protein [Maritalea sp.]|uniref:hypothetical protein n=1 Tax=Maritalea sp. TaxID=2003361 RepID=UPI003EF96607
MFNLKSKTKLAKLQHIEDPVGFLAPRGRATQQIHVEEAHSCGEFLSDKGTTIVCTNPEGEVGVALVTGALSTGGTVTIYGEEQAGMANAPEGAQFVSAGGEAEKDVLAQIGHFWVMPPVMADLDRYLTTWIASGFRPLVCISPRDEFLLLRGFVQEIVSVGNPMAAERLIFARSEAEGWEKLSELLAN